MTFEELIEKYRNQIATSKNKVITVKEIISEISRLSCDNKPITNEQQISILEKLREEIAFESALMHSMDNSQHLELIDQAIKALGGNKNDA